MGTHLVSFASNGPIRMKQVQEMMENIRNSSAHLTILGGDLNYDLRNDYENESKGVNVETTYKEVTGELRDSFLHYVDKDTSTPVEERDSTANTFENSYRDDNIDSEILDYIFHKSNSSKYQIKVKHYQVIDLKSKILSEMSKEECTNKL